MAGLRNVLRPFLFRKKVVPLPGAGLGFTLEERDWVTRRAPIGKRTPRDPYLHRIRIIRGGVLFTILNTVMKVAHEQSRTLYACTQLRV